MKYSKIIAFILSMLLLVTVFASCGNTEDPTGTTTATTEEVTYTVEFVYLLTSKTETVKAGEKVENFTPTKEYHVFNGWYLNGELFDLNTPITEDIILVAKFSVDPNVASREGFLSLVAQRKPATVNSITIMGGLSQVNGERIGESNVATTVKFEDNCFVSDDGSVKVPVVLTKELAEGLFAEVEEVINEKYSIENDGEYSVLVEYKTATGAHYKVQFSARADNTLGGIQKTAIAEDGSSSVVFRLASISYS